MHTASEADSTDAVLLIDASNAFNALNRAASLHKIRVQRFITSLQAASCIKQCWFADDASEAGSIAEIRRWWDTLNNLGPDFGYFPNAKKG